MAADSKLTIDQRPLEGLDGVVVRPRGPIRARAGEQFRKHIDALLEDAPTALVLDMGACEGIDSTAAGYLLRIHDAVKSRGGQLALCHLTQSVQLVIDSIGLTNFFVVCDTLDDAEDRLRDG